MGPCNTRNRYTILPLLLLLLLILIITPSTSSLSPTDTVTKKLINDLCSNSWLNPHFCITWLTTGNQTTSMNIHRLLELTVEKNRAFGLETQALMSGLARGSGKDNQLKKSLESCVQGYGVSIKKLEEARELLRNGSFKQAYFAIDKAHEYSYVCKDEFEGASNEPALALNRSDKFITVSYIAMRLAQLLN